MDTPNHPFRAAKPAIAQRVLNAIETGYSEWQRCLYLNNIDLGAEGLDFLLSTLPENMRGLSALNLSGTNLTDESIPALCAVLKSFPQLRSLNLENNHITAAGLKQLADEGMPEVPHLQILYLKQNPLSPEGGEVLGDIITRYPSLLRLEATNTKLGDTGMQAFAEALKDNRTLRYVSAGINGASAKGAAAFVTTLQYNHHLTNIHCGQDSPEINAAIMAAGRQLRSRNLISFHPADGQTKGFFYQNRQRASFLQESYEDPDYDELPQHELADLYARSGAVFYTPHELLPIVDEGADWREQTSDYMRFAQFLKTLPALPEAGADFGEALFRKDGKSGFTPLDNPANSEEGATLMERLETSGQKLTREYLSRSTERGSTLLQALAQGNAGHRLVEFLNTRGIKLGEAQLLDAKGAANTLMQTLMERGQTNTLFRPENWVGKAVGELNRVFSALPDSVKEQIDISRTKSRMLQSTSGQGRGR